MGIYWSKIFNKNTNNNSNSDDNSPEKVINLLTTSENENEDKITKDYIDNFVDEWYNNNPDVDLGSFKLGAAEIDIIPDFIEKKIYKKSLLISFTLLKKICEETSINLLDHEIKLTLKPKVNKNNS